MTDSIHSATPVFAEAAQSVQRRLFVRKGLRTMLQMWPMAAGVVLFLFVLRLAGFHFAGAALAFVLLVLWLAGCFAYAWLHKPNDYAALAHWDKAAVRSDDFANAWWFEQQSQPTRGQQWHVAQQHGKLADALAKLRADLPLPNVRWLALLPVGALGLLLLPVRDAAGLPDAQLSVQAKELAKREGKKVADAKLDADKMKVLNEFEKKELAKLQQKVQDTAKALAQDPKTAREVLGQLEKSARDAERLAEKLAVGDAAWASEQMVAEMRKHADTADLGAAVANKSAENTGARAQQLADKLKDHKIAKETSARFAETLRDIGKQAQPQDKERTVGQHVIAADKDLAQALTQEAGREFQALADKMRALAARDKARAELEKLAQQLRESGSNVAGQGAGGMQQLAGNDASQNQSEANAQSGQMMTLPNAAQTPQMQPPGLSNGMQNGQNQQGQNGQQQLLTMTPAQGNAQQAKPGQQGDSSKDGKSDNNRPMLFAPVPNSNPNQSPDIAIVGSTPGNSNGPQPGNGTAPLGNKPTEAIKPNQTASVNAQRNTDGASSTRSIEGQTHNEQAARSAEASALNAISAEENALDDSALPPARRAQVRRYFTELRKRFEKQD